MTTYSTSADDATRRDGSRLSEGLGPNAEDDQCSAPPRVTDAPADVWLVYGDLDRDATHWECCRDGEVAWCEDKQYDSDVHYVRGDRYDDLRTALTELLACHTESAGWSMSMLKDRAEFDAMLQRSQERLEAAMGVARVALGAQRGAKRTATARTKGRGMNRRSRPLWVRLSALLGLVAVAGCVDMVQPPDIAVAEELCAKRGGYAHAQRWERGAVLDVNCKDGTQLNVRLPKKG